MNLKLTAMLLALACLPGCAQLAETPILMGGKESVSYTHLRAHEK